MKRLFFVLFTFICMAVSVHAQTEYGLKFSSLINDDLSLENAIRLGLENNTEFLAARQEIIIAEQRINEAKFRYLPQFALEGTATAYDLDYPMVLSNSVANRLLPGQGISKNKDQFYGVGITATQYLYSGGRIRGTLKMARANLKRAQSHYETIKNAVVRDIKISFNNLLFAQQNDKLAAEILEKAQSWNKSNSGDLWTRIRVHSLLARFKAQRSQAAQQLQEAQLAMLISLNKELNASFSIKGNFEPVTTDWDLSHLNLWAMEFRPELKSALYALEVDNISIDLALSKRYPDILLNGSYEQLGNDSLSDTNKQISLAVRLPIPYNWSSQLSQKRAEQRQSTLRRSKIEDTIRQQVASSFSTMKFWQEEVLSRQQETQELQTLFERAQKNASKAGIAPLEALQAYFQTVHDYLEAIRQNRIAKAELEWAIGQDFGQDLK